MHSGLQPYESNKLSNATSHTNNNQPGFLFKKDARQTNPYKHQVGSGSFPKIEKTVTIMLPSTKPPLHSTQSRNSIFGKQKNLRNTPTMSSSLKKKSLLPGVNSNTPTTLAIMPDPTQTLTLQNKVQFQKIFPLARSNSGRRRKSPTEGTVPGESTNQFMGHGLKSIGVLQPLIIDRKFEIMARNYPHKELYQTIPTRKFKVNGVKVVDRYNHMKKQIFDFIKNHNIHSPKQSPQHSLIPMLSDPLQ